MAGIVTALQLTLAFGAGLGSVGESCRHARRGVVFQDRIDLRTTRVGGGNEEIGLKIAARVISHVDLFQRPALLTRHGFDALIVTLLGERGI